MNHKLISQNNSTNLTAPLKSIPLKEWNHA